MKLLVLLLLLLLLLLLMNNNHDLIQLCSLGGLSLLSSDDLDPQTFNASRLEQVAALESLMRRASTTALPPLSECLALERPPPLRPGLHAGPLF